MSAFLLPSYPSAIVTSRNGRFDDIYLHPAYSDTICLVDCRTKRIGGICAEMIAGRYPEIDMTDMPQAPIPSRYGSGVIHGKNSLAGNQYFCSLGKGAVVGCDAGGCVGIVFGSC